ncbi:MAG: hypothetical protein OEY78_10905 [Gammaproteobacteria bacterium]|nr:hypothetical protein [Gammaproteobacteria bacterium]
MKKLVPLLFALAFTSPVLASGDSKEEPTRHIKLAKVTSMADARKIFIDKTTEIKSYKKLGAAELHQLHIITYSLEKSVAYFAENLEKESRELAKEMAVVVEDIHIDSENNRKEKTQQHLTKYFKLADKFIPGILEYGHVAMPNKVN